MSRKSKRIVSFCTFVFFGGLVACSQDGPSGGEDTGIDIDVSDFDADDTSRVCGDGRVDAPYEQCEPGTTASCADGGFEFGIASCTRQSCAK